MSVVIIDYKVGNLASVQRAFSRVGLETTITDNLNMIKDADALILPGVGAFQDAMIDLENSGLIPAIKEHVSKGKLLIGICLGMQLLFESSTEFGFYKGLSFIDGTVEFLDVDLKIPHMGWNQLIINRKEDIISYIEKESYVYFVHSYYVKTDEKNLVAYTEYGEKIPAIVQKDNVIGLQFHPEKSGEVGMSLLQAIKEMIL